MNVKEWYFRGVDQDSESRAWLEDVIARRSSAGKHLHIHEKASRTVECRNGDEDCRIWVQQEYLRSTESSCDPEGMGR